MNFSLFNSVFFTLFDTLVIWVFSDRLLDAARPTAPGSPLPLLALCEFYWWVYDLWMTGVRSCYNEGNRTAETLTMDSLTKHFFPSDIFMYWFASISINWTTKTERLLRQSPLGAEIKSRLYIISRCILMLIRWHDWRRTDLDGILIPCLNLILCKNILVLSIVYIFFLKILKTRRRTA